MTLCATAQNGGGLFERGYVSNEASNPRSGESLLSLPGSHGSDSDADAPMGSGIAVLMGLGVAYVVAKKRKEE
ncbi:MAG: hypothetical protein IJP44_05325 [Bacteroidales bacterium]|nr:hypothetical protein [Bacteroidales bacterium]